MQKGPAAQSPVALLYALQAQSGGNYVVAGSLGTWPSGYIVHTYISYILLSC